MVDSFNSTYVFDRDDFYNREKRKTIKRHYMTFGKEGFLIGLILVGLVFYFTFVFEIIPVIIVPFIAFFGLVLSVVQLFRQTHALAIAGLGLNLFVLIFSLVAIVI
jgi:hypothetical protein